ncbi:MAG: ABC transporter ATP-binding protein [Myxococcales bacterium]|nr:ABC transporter ATP-binding protein [Myxococcales bacterium]
MSPSMIRAQHLTKRFGAFTAVDDLSIDVAQGSLFAFLGANGSGKSTTIKMLIGLLTPSQGEVVVDGVDVIARPRRVRDRIGYMGQKVSLYQGLTLRENVEFYGGLYGLAGAALERRWCAVRERFDLAEAEAERPEHLPAGLRQRAGLALATLHQPRVLFLDEPTAGVDVHSRSLFWDRIQDEVAAGVTVFVTTHFLEEAEYCDRVSFIDAGRLIADATPDGLRARWSDGSRIRCPRPPGDAGRLREALRAAGFAIEAEPEDGAELRLRAAQLDSAALAALAAILGPALAGRVHIEQPTMNEIFTRLIESSNPTPHAGAETGP